MASVRRRSDTGMLFLDFRFEGRRHRPPLEWIDTPANRRHATRLLEGIDRDIAAGAFDPQHPFADLAGGGRTSRRVDRPLSPTALPRFDVFARQWLQENAPRWRPATRMAMRGIVDVHLAPRLKNLRIDQVTRAGVLRLRADLCEPAGPSQKTLSPKRVNSVIDVLRAILTEAVRHFGIAAVASDIPRLRQQRPVVRPFSLGEIHRILDAAAPTDRDYLLVRFFTGMRTGEIDGLTWDHVDFAARRIRIRQSWSSRRLQRPKTPASERDIAMSPPVMAALQRQAAVTRPLGAYVFCNRVGNPLATNSVSERMWRPLLERVGLPYRRIYQTRHTAATLWLAVGENPAWIARQLGHSNSQLLFSTYARFIPDATHRDGIAMQRLLARVRPQPAPPPLAHPAGRRPPGVAQQELPL